MPDTTKLTALTSTGRVPAVQDGSPRRTHWSDMMAVLRLDLLPVRPVHVVVAAAALVSGWFAFRVLSGSPGAAVLVLGTGVSLVGWFNDSKSRLPLLYAALPLRRSAVVDARYLLAALGLTITAVAGLIEAHIDGSPGTAANQLLWGCTPAVALIALAPVVVAGRRRTGTDLVTFLLLFACVVGVYCVLVMAVIVAFQVEVRAGLPDLALTDPAAAVVLAALVPGSWLVCRRLYTRKDL